MNVPLICNQDVDATFRESHRVHHIRPQNLAASPFTISGSRSLRFYKRRSSMKEQSTIMPLSVRPGVGPTLFFVGGHISPGINGPLSLLCHLSSTPRVPSCGQKERNIPLRRIFRSIRADDQKSGSCNLPICCPAKVGFKKFKKCFTYRTRMRQVLYD